MSQEGIQAALRDARAAASSLASALVALERLAADASAPAGAGWRLIEQRHDRTYKWPDDSRGGGLHRFARFDVYELDGLKLALGYGTSDAGRLEHVGVFKLGSGGGSPKPVTYFQPADDFKQTGALLAPVRGKGGSRNKQMFRPGDQLPSPYDQLTTVAMRARRNDYRFDVVGVVAKDSDVTTMLIHGATQVRLRGI